MKLQNFFLYLIFIFAFTGTLISIDIGFTIKPPQVFAILLFMLFILDIIRKKIIILPLYNNQNSDYSENTINISIKSYLPFLFFILSILPSFMSETIFSEIYEPVSSFRMLFNYLFLQLIFFVITVYLNDKNKLFKSLKYLFISYITILFFGFYQQIGFYLSFYNPLDYVGFHSLFVDFYGPFLRISPATFANEFGEITQTILIFYTTYLFIYSKEISFSKKIALYSFLFILISTLVLNFTRASWIVYFLYLISMFFTLKIKLSKRFFIVFFTSLSIIGLYFLNLETDIFNILRIIDRFVEFNDLSQNSASMRIITWEESYNLFFKNNFTILFGNGWGNAIDTHNVPLQLLAETGLSGFLGFYTLMFYLSKKFYHNIIISSDLFFKFTSISIFYSFLGCIIFDFTNHGIYHFVFWFIISIGFCLNKILNKIYT